LYVTPDETNLQVGGTVTFTLVSPNGSPVTDASWSVDNSALAAISPDATTPSNGNLHAIEPGEVTVTASSALGTAQAKATIYAVGALPAGTPAWVFYPQTQNGALPLGIKARRNNPDDPFVYLVGFEGNVSTATAVDGSGHLMQRVTVPP